MATRNDKTGLWDFENLPMPSSSKGLAPQTASIRKLDDNLKPATLVWPSIVSVRLSAPYPVDGIRNNNFSGPGLILDKAEGYVLCDRRTVPISISDISIIFCPTAGHSG